MESRFGFFWVLLGFIGFYVLDIGFYVLDIFEEIKKVLKVFMHTVMLL